LNSQGNPVIAPLVYVVTIALFVIIAVGVYVARVEMYRTLRRYGVDPYSRGWRHAGSWTWVLKYREVCIQHGLSLRYWNIHQRCLAFGKVLVAVWLALVVLKFWAASGFRVG
jgi:hypothetical protein